MKNINEITSILELSSRTVGKMLKRANRGCELCGWRAATCDIHHIVERKEGGSNDLNNLIILCPNCHRTVHSLGDNFISIAELVEKSIQYMFSDWKDYYMLMPATKYRIVADKQCIRESCLNIVPKHKKRKYCSQECMHLAKIKVNWSALNLPELLIKYNYNLSKIGKIIGVSDNSIKKHCKVHDIPINRTKYKHRKRIF